MTKKLKCTAHGQHYQRHQRHKQQQQQQQKWIALTTPLTSSWINKNGGMPKQTPHKMVASNSNNKVFGVSQVECKKQTTKKENRGKAPGVQLVNNCNELVNSAGTCDNN